MAGKLCPLASLERICVEGNCAVWIEETEECGRCEKGVVHAPRSVIQKHTCPYCEGHWKRITYSGCGLAQGG